MRLWIGIKRSMFNLESASFGDLAFSSCWFCQDILAVVAGYDWLGVTEHNVGLAASSAFNIHKVRVGSWNQSFQFVAVSFVFVSWVEQVSVHCWILWIIFIFWLTTQPIKVEEILKYDHKSIESLALFCEIIANNNF